MTKKITYIILGVLWAIFALPPVVAGFLYVWFGIQIMSVGQMHIALLATLALAFTTVIAIWICGEYYD